MVKLFPVGTRTEFVDLVCGGLSLQDAAIAVGASEGTASTWWRQSGGMTLKFARVGGGLADPVVDPVEVGGRALTLDQRGMIQMGRQQQLSYAQIGAAIGRDKSVVWREVNRNTSPGRDLLRVSGAHESASVQTPTEAVQAARERGALPTDRGLDGRGVEPETDLVHGGALLRR